MAEYIEIEAPKKVCDVLGRYFKDSEWENICRFVENESNHEYVLRCSKHQKSYDLPLRLGNLLDSLKDFHKNKNRIGSMDLGEARLDLVTGVLTRADQKEVALTEKEVEVLRLLHERKGDITSKCDLYSEIWGYVKGVETHTLETHIYRLRQKIEIDAAKPKILLTDQNGYKLG